MEYKEYLPKVNPQVGYSISHKFENMEETQYFKEMMELISEENPTIAKFIKRWAEMTQEPCDFHSAFCGMMVYLMLRGQAEANYMEETIRL